MAAHDAGREAGSGGSFLPERAGLRALNPSLSPEQLDRKVKESFLYAAS